MNAIRMMGGRAQWCADAPVPRAAPGEAIIRPVRMGIGPADLVDAQAGGPDRTLGREFVGIVEDVQPRPGRDEQRKWIGKRVVGSAHILCGVCERCRAGLSAHCRDRATLGSGSRDGCFAERFALPVTNLVEVPKSIEDDAAVIIPALAGAIHAAKVVNLEGRPLVTILGDSVLALLIAQVAAHRNQSVRVLGTDPARFTLCEKWGIKHRHADEAGRRQDQDVVVDAIGTRESLDLSAQLVRPRGSIVLCAAPTGAAEQEGSPALLRAAREDELEIHGARGENFPEAAASLASGAIDALSLITSRHRLPDFPVAARAAGAAGSIKVVLSP